MPLDKSCEVLRIVRIFERITYPDEFLFGEEVQTLELGRIQGQLVQICELVQEFFIFFG